MNYMNIVKDEHDGNKYNIEYVKNHSPAKAVVDETTAKLLRQAKIAGRSELAFDLRKLLEMSY